MIETRNAWPLDLDHLPWCYAISLDGGVLVDPSGRRFGRPHDCVYRMDAADAGIKWACDCRLGRVARDGFRVLQTFP